MINTRDNLVLISGNAGDGKTAFLKQLDEKTNRITNSGKRLVIDFDATESNSPEQTQTDKLASLLASFSDEALEKKDTLDTVYIIAINTGMIMHFFNNTEQFSKLKEAVIKKMNTNGEEGSSPWNILFLDLNNRSIFNAYDQEGANSNSIYDKIVKKLFDPSGFIWVNCKDCPVKNKCIVNFNAQSLNEPLVSERLKLLLNFVHFDSEFHITTRNLLNILSYLAISHHSYYHTDNFCEQIRKHVQELSNFEQLLNNGSVQILSAEKGILVRKELNHLADFTQKLYYNLAMNDRQLFPESKILKNKSYDLGGDLIDLLNGENQCNDFVNRSNQKVDKISSFIFFNLESILAGAIDYSLSPFEQFIFRIYGKVIERIYMELSTMVGIITEEKETEILNHVKDMLLELFNIMKRREFFVNETLEVKDLARYPFFHEYIDLIKRTSALFDPENEEDYELFDDVNDKINRHIGYYLKKLIHKHQGLKNWEEETDSLYLIRDKNVERSLFRRFDEVEFNLEPELPFNREQYPYVDCLLRFLTLNVNAQVAFTMNVGFYNYLRSISIGYEPMEVEVQSLSQIKILVEALKKIPGSSKEKDELYFMNVEMQESFKVHYRTAMGKKTLMVEKKR